MAQKNSKGRGKSYAYTPATRNIGWKILSLILAALFVGAGIACSIGWVKAVQLEKQLNAQLPSDGDNSGNGDGDNTDDDNPGGSEDEPDNMVISVGDYDEDSLMTMFISALSADGVEVQSDTSSTFEITAEIKPDNTTNQYLNWSIGWLDSSSEWATGKAVNDYVTVTPTEEGAHTATAECKQAFSEPIIVTVSTTDGTNLTADCRCDYIKHVIKTDIVVPRATYESGAGAPAFSTTSEPPYTVSLYSEATDYPVNTATVKKIHTQVVLGEGTLNKDTFTTTITYTWMGNFYNELKKRGYDLSASAIKITTPEGYFFNGNKGCTELLTTKFFSDANYAKAVIEVLNTVQTGIQFTVTTTGQYSSCTNRYVALVDASHLAVKAGSVTVTPGIEFY